MSGVRNREHGAEQGGAARSKCAGRLGRLWGAERARTPNHFVPQRACTLPAPCLTAAEETSGRGQEEPPNPRPPAPPCPPRANNYRTEEERAEERPQGMTRGQGVSHQARRQHKEHRQGHNQRQQGEQTANAQTAAGVGTGGAGTRATGRCGGGGGGGGAGEGAPPNVVHTAAHRACRAKPEAQP